MSKTSLFCFRGSALTVVRIGPANAQKQKHNRKRVDLNGNPTERKVGHPAPTNRGIWVFPKGYEDAFFYAHVWDRHLPKHLQYSNLIAIEDDDLRNTRWEERDRKIEKVMRDVGKKIIHWDRPFYSHIGYHGQVEYAHWYLWENAKDWANVARKMVWTNYRYGSSLYRVRYASDHFELFLPM